MKTARRHPGSTAGTFGGDGQQRPNDGQTQTCIENM